VGFRSGGTGEYSLTDARRSRCCGPRAGRRQRQGRGRRRRRRRTHLKRIFAKTNARNRAELGRLLLSGAPGSLDVP